MKKIILALILLVSLSARVNAQGCVAIRTVGGLNTMEHAGMMHMDSSSKMPDPKKWEFNMAYRYFNSYRHFNGTIEQTQRVTDGTEVRNFNRTMDLSLLRTLNDQ